MFTALLAISLASAAPQAAYQADSLQAFATVASQRVRDGYVYGEPSLSGGLVYSHPSGFYAGTELAAFQGESPVLPDDALFSLDSYAGWHAAFDEQRLALELLDYRLNTADNGSLSNQGMRLRYRFRRLDIGYAREFNKPLYVRYGSPPYSYGVFHEYDLARITLDWNQPLGKTLRLSAGAGLTKIGTFDSRYSFASVGLSWHWQHTDWQLMVFHADRDLERIYGPEMKRQTLVLRLAMPFRIF